MKEEERENWEGKGVEKKKKKDRRPAGSGTIIWQSRARPAADIACPLSTDTLTPARVTNILSLCVREEEEKKPRGAFTQLDPTPTRNMADTAPTEEKQQSDMPAQHDTDPQPSLLESALDAVQAKVSDVIEAVSGEKKDDQDQEEQKSSEQPDSADSTAPSVETTTWNPIDAIGDSINSAREYLAEKMESSSEDPPKDDETVVTITTTTVEEPSTEPKSSFGVPSFVTEALENARGVTGFDDRIQALLDAAKNAVGQGEEEVKKDAEADQVLEDTAGGLSDSLSDALKSIGDRAHEVAEATEKNFEGAWESAKESASDAVEGAKEVLQDTAEDVEKKAEDVLESAKETSDAVTSDAANIVEDVKEAAQDATDAVENKIENTATSAKEATDAVTSTVSEAADDAKDSVQDVAESFEKKLEETVESTTEAAKEAVDDVKDSVQDVAESAEKKLEDTVESTAEAANEAADVVSETVEDAKDAAVSAEKKLEEFAVDYTKPDESSHDLSSTVSEAVDNAKDVVEDVGETVEKKLESTVEAVSDYFKPKEPTPDLSTTASEMLQDAAEEVKDAADAAKEKLESAYESATDYFKPKESTPDLSATVSDAVEDAVDKVKDAAEAAEEKVESAVESVTDYFKPKEPTPELSSFVAESLHDAADTASDLAESAGEKIESAVESVTDYFRPNEPTSDLSTTVSDAAQDAVDAAKDTAETVEKKLESALEAASDYFKPEEEKAKDQATVISDAAQDAADTAHDVAETMEKKLESFVESTAGEEEPSSTTTGEEAPPDPEGTTSFSFGLPDSLHNAYNSAADAMHGLSEKIGEAFEPTLDAVEKVEIVQSVEDVPPAAAEEASSGFLPESIQNAFNAVSETVPDTSSALKDKFDSLTSVEEKEKTPEKPEEPEETKPVEESESKGFIPESIQSAWNNVVETVSDASANIKEKVEGAFETTDESIKATDETQPITIVCEEDTLDKTKMEDSDSILPDSVQSALDTVTSTVSDASAALKEKLDEAVEGTQEMLKSEEPEKTEEEKKHEEPGEPVKEEPTASEEPSSVTSFFSDGFQALKDKASDVAEYAEKAFGESNDEPKPEEGVEEDKAVLSQEKLSENAPSGEEPQPASGGIPDVIHNAYNTVADTVATISEKVSENVESAVEAASEALKPSEGEEEKKETSEVVEAPVVDSVPDENKEQHPEEPSSVTSFLSEGFQKVSDSVKDAANYVEETVVSAFEEKKEEEPSSDEAKPAENENEKTEDKNESVFDQAKEFAESALDSAKDSAEDATKKLDEAFAHIEESVEKVLLSESDAPPPAAANEPVVVGVEEPSKDVEEPARESVIQSLQESASNAFDAAADALYAKPSEPTLSEETPVQEEKPAEPEGDSAIQKVEDTVGSVFDSVKNVFSSESSEPSQTTEAEEPIVAHVIEPTESAPEPVIHEDHEKTPTQESFSSSDAVETVRIAVAPTVKSEPEGQKNSEDENNTFSDVIHATYDSLTSTVWGGEKKEEEQSVPEPAKEKVPEETFEKVPVSSDIEEVVVMEVQRPLNQEPKEEQPQAREDLSTPQATDGDKKEIFVFVAKDAAEHLPKDEDVLAEDFITKATESIDQLSEALRRESFSDISCAETREEFTQAIETLKESAFPNYKQLSVTPTQMDSPPDLSPNAPPQGIEDPAKYFEQLGSSPPADIVPTHDPLSGAVSSSNDSEDSSGFEKVDPHSDLLAEYSANFQNQMQQSLYGQLPDDPEGGGYRFDDDEHVDMSSHPHDDVLEKTYGDVHDKVDDLINDLAEQEGAQALAKAVEEAPKKVDEFLSRTDDSWSRPEEGHEHHHHEHPHEHQYDFTSEEEKLPEKPKELHIGFNDATQQLDDFLGHPKPTPPSETVSPSDSGRDTVGRLIGEASDEEEPHFGAQTPEETTFERQGPLTIPADLIEQPEPEDYPVPTHPYPEEPRRHIGFETEPRPPTPPKDISDEDVKPSTVHVGHHHESHHDPTRPILKHGSYSTRGTSGPWFDFKTVDPRVLDLIYWRDPKKSGIALGATLAVLFILARYPIISVLSYAGLAALAGTLGFRILKAVEAQIKKTDGGNPFQPYLEKELAVPQEKVHEQVDVLVEHGQHLIAQLRRLFLVENIVDSVKFGLLLWSLTYIGAWFSGCTLAFLAVLAIFSVPKVYETYQEPIDQHLGVVKAHIDNVSNIIEEKVPFLKRADAEKKEQ